jgi:hypothetical protein
VGLVLATSDALGATLASDEAEVETEGEGLGVLQAASTIIKITADSNRLRVNMKAPYNKNGP